MDETFSFLKSHPHSKDFFCWKEGFEDWKLVGSVEELALAYLPSEKTPKRAPPPPPTPIVTPTPTPIVLAPLEKPLEKQPEEPPLNLPLQSTTATPESLTPVKPETIHRKHERFDLRFRVILRSHQITFRTFSKNISLGGIATEHPIPRELIHESCTIYIANPNGEENIKFNIKFATERQDTKYFYFTEISPDSQNKLKKWIDAMSKTLKKAS